MRISVSTKETGTAIATKVANRLCSLTSIHQNWKDDYGRTSILRNLLFMKNSKGFLRIHRRSFKELLNLNA
jgi:hypothetical protein